MIFRNLSFATFCIIIFLFSQSIFGQVELLGKVYFKDDGKPKSNYENNYVEWFANLDSTWKEDMVDQGYADKKSGYFVFPVKTHEWLASPEFAQDMGFLNFEKIPDSTDLFKHEGFLVCWETSGGDTNLVEWDSVEVEYHYFAVNPAGPPKAKLKERTKKHPNYPQFPKDNDIKKWTKKWLKDKDKKLKKVKGK